VVTAGQAERSPGTEERSAGRPGAGCGYRLAPMDLGEKTIERPGDRCEECGAKLTAREIEAVMESGGPALCSIHADEVVPVAEDEAEFGDQ
jgi:hypothetical protein